MPANVELFSPSRRAWANAKSRFGPVTPFVPARASVWHAPQWLTNIFLPATTSRSLDSLPHAPTAPISAAPISTLATCRALNRSLPIGADVQPTAMPDVHGRAHVTGRPEALGPDPLGGVPEVHESVRDGLHERGRAAHERARAVGRPIATSSRSPRSTRPRRPVHAGLRSRVSVSSRSSAGFAAARRCSSSR